MTRKKSRMTTTVSIDRKAEQILHLIAAPPLLPPARVYRPVADRRSS